MLAQQYWTNYMKEAQSLEINTKITAALEAAQLDYNLTVK